MSTLRAFIAIPLPQSTLDRLSTLQDRLAAELPPHSVRWVAPSGVHLTLKFLGDVDESRVASIKNALAAVASVAPPSPARAKGLGCFPNLKRPQVLWIGVDDPSPRLGALQAAVEEAMAGIGFDKEERAFHPHLTLGRVSRRTSSADKSRIGDVIRSMQSTMEAGHIPGAQISLIRSTLRPTGAEYSTLATFRLART
jgi:RNA 2',3'-cyclic 3'-phosphodiesterase